MRRGQAFSVMKMLIAGAFAMMMLVMVYFFTQTQPPLENSSLVLRSLAEYAARAPGKCFERSEVQFIKGEVITASSTNADCIQGEVFLTTGADPALGCAACSASCAVRGDIRVPVTAKSSSGTVTVTIGQRCP